MMKVEPTTYTKVVKNRIEETVIQVKWGMSETIGDERIISSLCRFGDEHTIAVEAFVIPRFSIKTSKEWYDDDGIKAIADEIGLLDLETAEFETTKESQLTDNEKYIGYVAGVGFDEAHRLMNTIRLDDSWERESNGQNDKQVEPVPQPKQL